MQTFTKIIAGVATATVMTATTALAGAPDQATAMKHLASYIGSWETSGTTTDAFPNLPAGVEYTEVTEYRWNGEMDTVVSNWKMSTKKGQVLSMGTGMLTWSDDHKTLVLEYTGQDKGTPFHGSATLSKLTENASSWQCYEQDAKGTQIWYLSTDTFPNGPGNSWSSSMQSCDSNWQSTGDTETSSMSRVNMFTKHCGPIADMIGTWTWKTKDDAGTPMTKTNTYEWGPGKRSIMCRFYETRNGETTLMACETMYSTEDGKGIRGNYWNNKGGNIDWLITEMTENGSNAHWSSNFWGNSADGTPISGEITGHMTNANQFNYNIVRMNYGGTDMPTEGMNPENRLFKRTSTMATVPTN